MDHIQTKNYLRLSPLLTLDAFEVQFNEGKKLIKRSLKTKEKERIRSSLRKQTLETDYFDATLTQNLRWRHTKVSRVKQLIYAMRTLKIFFKKSHCQNIPVLLTNRRNQAFEYLTVMDFFS